MDMCPLYSLPALVIIWGSEAEEYVRLIVS